MSECDIKILANEFWKKGFIYIPNFFSLDLMDELQQLILAHYGDNPEFCHDAEFLKKSKTEVIPWFPQRQGQKEFHRVDQDVRLKNLTTAILGEGWSNQYSMVMLSKAGTRGQAWHQDCPSEDPSQFNLNRLVYTMDITEKTGGQVVVRPSTHTQGLMTVGDPDENFKDQIEIAPKKGDLVLLHGHTWHKIRPTNQNRVSTNYRAGPKGVPEGITDICIYRNMRYQFSTNTILEERALT
jgi:hypothetical protein